MAKDERPRGTIFCTQGLSTPQRPLQHSLRTGGVALVQPYLAEMIEGLHILRTLVSEESLGKIVSKLTVFFFLGVPALGLIQAGEAQANAVDLKPLIALCCSRYVQSL